MEGTLFFFFVFSHLKRYIFLHSLLVASGSFGRGEHYNGGRVSRSFLSVLSHFLQLLSQPGRQRMPQFVQQLGEFHVVITIVAGQKCSALGPEEEMKGYFILIVKVYILYTWTIFKSVSSTRYWFKTAIKHMDCLFSTI